MFGIRLNPARLALVSVGVAAVFALCSDQTRAVNTNPYELREGRWTFRGPRTVLGQGRDESVELRKDDGKWVIVLTGVLYRSVNDRQARESGPRVETRGPFEVSISPPYLQVWSDGGAEETTFRFEGETLVWPALVQLDDRTWHYKAGRTNCRFLCKHAPRQVSKGDAEFPATSAADTGWSKHYSFARQSDPRGGDREVLQFYQLYRGKVHESCKIIWDRWGRPRFDGSHWFNIDEKRFRRDTVKGKTDGSE